MSIRFKLAAAAFGLALTVSAVPMPSSSADATAAPTAAPNAAMSVMPAAMPPSAATLTNARNLRARKLLPTGGATLSGLLQQSNSCNRVSFKPSLLTIFPPVYLAVQQRIRLVGCVILNGHYAPASILVPRNAPFVTVRAKNGTFKVLVH